MTWAVVISVAVVSLVVVLFLARYRHREVVMDWAGVMSPETARILAQVEENADLDHHMAQDAWAHALAAQERQEWQEAVRQLELAFWVIEDCTPGRLERLRSMAYLCRQVAAVMPLPPVRPSSYRLARARGLAVLGALAHAFLVTPAERLALRAQVLVATFRLLVWTLQRTKERAAGRPAPGQAWDLFKAGLEDWLTADKAHLETYRAAMMTLADHLRREVPVSLG